MTTVRTKIVVQFDDQFSEAAKRANENYFKSFEEAQKKIASFKPIFETPFQEYFEDLTKYFNELNAFDQTVLVSKLLAGSVAVGAISTNFVILEATVAAFYLTWAAGSKLSEWVVGDQKVDEYVDGVKVSLEQLSNLETPVLSPIPQDTMQALENAKSCLQQIQQLQEIFITVELVDNAMKEAKQLRQEIERIFSKDIIQRIKIIEEKTHLTTPTFSGGSDSIFNDSSIELQTPSLDLSGFGDAVSTSSNTSTGTNFPGFSSGIERVPRDMLAIIHKDEAVLPKNSAEDFRRGGSSGITIQNMDFSFNVPNGLKLDREEFRNLAFQMRDELKRLDQRMN
jgi:hypothetical protein